MSFAAWMTPAEHAKWRKDLRADYVRIRQVLRPAHTSLSYGIVDSDDVAPNALAVLEVTQ